MKEGKREHPPDTAVTVMTELPALKVAVIVRVEYLKDRCMRVCVCVSAHFREGERGNWGDGERGRERRGKT